MNINMTAQNIIQTFILRGILELGIMNPVSMLATYVFSIEFQAKVTLLFAINVFTAILATNILVACPHSCL